MGPHPGVRSGHLSGRVPDKVITVGIEAEAEEADALHESVRLLALAVGPEEGVDKLDTRALAEARLALLGRVEHGGFAGLEEAAELVHEALTRLEKVFQHFAVFRVADAANNVLGDLDLGVELDQEQPELAGDIGDGGEAALAVDGPVKNPLA